MISMRCAFCSHQIRVPYRIEENPLISAFPDWYRLVSGTRTVHGASLFVLKSMGVKFMKATAGKASILDNVDWGSVFMFRFHESNFVGMKVFQAGAANPSPQVAAIWPHHPNVQGEVGLLAGHLFGSKTLVPIDNVTLVSSAKIEDLRLDDAATTVTGSILLFEKHGPTMPVRFSQEQIFFLDLETGELKERPPGRVVAQVVKWALVQNVLDKFETICEFAATLR
jgi:hypothetical protein